MGKPAGAEIRFIASNFRVNGVHKKAGHAGRSNLERISRSLVAPEASFSDDDFVGRNKTFYRRDLGRHRIFPLGIPARHRDRLPNCLLSRIGIPHEKWL
jgi:hypothetical protein